MRNATKYKLIDGLTAVGLSALLALSFTGSVSYAQEKAAEAEEPHQIGDTTYYDDGMEIRTLPNGDLEIKMPQKCGGAARVRRRPLSPAPPPPQQ